MRVIPNYGWFDRTCFVSAVDSRFHTIGNQNSEVCLEPLQYLFNADHFGSYCCSSYSGFTLQNYPQSVLFGSAFINMLLLTYLHSSLKLQTVVWIFFVRVGLSVAAFCGLVGFIVFHEESYFVSSICEISAGACMICFLCCFALDSDCFSHHTNTTLSSASLMVSSADVRAF